MIKHEFGDIKFSEMNAREVHVRFNALVGSSTRPRAVIKQGFNERFNDSYVHFDELRKVNFETGPEF